MLAEPRRYQGFMAKDITAQIKNPLRTLRYLGKSAAMSFPAGREFSKMEEKIAEYAKQPAMKKQPARVPEV